MPSEKSERANRIFDALHAVIPDARGALQFTNPLELLIATILSAQATDKLVNKVTVGLFKKYKNAADYAAVPLDELEVDIGSVNFYRNKAKALKKCATVLVADFGSSVPETMDELVTLPGVGRKTANVVLGNAFGQPAIAVDTHVKRVAGRLGLTASENPDIIEADLAALFPEERWTLLSHLLILHGRSICKARKPNCAECAVSELCDYYKSERKKG
ncbi:MAG: endonuclease III [Proteobacteria bacterium]|nr:endonuclease III [Pseudomonadota bacterium]